MPNQQDKGALEETLNQLSSSMHVQSPILHEMMECDFTSTTPCLPRDEETEPPINAKAEVSKIYNSIKSNLSRVKAQLEQQLKDVLNVENIVSNVKQKKKDKEKYLNIMSELLSKKNIMKVYINVLDNINNNTLVTIEEFPEDIELSKSIDQSLENIIDRLNETIRTTQSFIDSVYDTIKERKCNRLC